MVLRSSLQGVGRKIVPLSASMIELVAKFVAAVFITPLLGYLGVCILEPVIWIICMLLVSFDFWMFLRQDKRRTLEVRRYAGGRTR